MKVQAKKDANVPAAKTQRSGRYVAPEQQVGSSFDHVDELPDDMEVENELNRSGPRENSPGTVQAKGSSGNPGSDAGEGDENALAARKKRERKTVKLAEILKRNNMDAPTPLLFKILEAVIPGVTLSDLLDGEDSIYELLFKPIKKEKAAQIERKLEADKETSGGRITHNVSSTIIQHNRLYSAASPKTKIVINGLETAALLDTGAEVCLMSMRMADRLGVPYTLSQKVSITDASCTSTVVRGVSNTVEVTIGEVTVPCPFMVVSTLAHDVILGMPFMLASSWTAKSFADGSISMTLTCPRTLRKTCFTWRAQDSKKTRTLEQLWSEEDLYREVSMKAVAKTLKDNGRA